MLFFQYLIKSQEKFSQVPIIVIKKSRDIKNLTNSPRS